MDKSTNSLNWFEIPVTNIERARRFYENIFSIQLEPTQELTVFTMAAFPSEFGNGKASGALALSAQHKPSMDGCIIYLNANPDMQPVLDKIVPAGGQIIIPKTQISPDIGFMAFFIDTEGNKMALHSTS